MAKFLCSRARPTGEQEYAYNAPSFAPCFYAAVCRTFGTEAVRRNMTYEKDHQANSDTVRIYRWRSDFEDTFHRVEKLQDE